MIWGYIGLQFSFKLFFLEYNYYVTIAHIFVLLVLILVFVSLFVCFIFIVLFLLYFYVCVVNQSINIKNKKIKKLSEIKTLALLNQTKFNSMYKKCDWTSTKGSLKQFTGRSENQHEFVQKNKKPVYTTSLSLVYSVLLPCISKRLVNSSWTKVLKSAQ